MASWKSVTKLLGAGAIGALDMYPDPDPFDSIQFLVDTGASRRVFAPRSPRERTSTPTMRYCRLPSYSESDPQRSPLTELTDAYNPSTHIHFLGVDDHGNAIVEFDESRALAGDWERVGSHVYRSLENTWASLGLEKRDMIAADLEESARYFDRLVAESGEDSVIDEDFEVSEDFQK